MCNFLFFLKVPHDLFKLTTANENSPRSGRRRVAQGLAAGSRLRLLLFVRYALGFSPMAFQAIFMEAIHALSRGPT